jgi:hypothetical protein
MVSMVLYTAEVGETELKLQGESAGIIAGVYLARGQKLIAESEGQADST